MTVLVCGGAGYIGSHFVRHLSNAGHELLVFDDFSTGHREAVAGHSVVVGSVLNPADLDHAFGTVRISAVVHFAAKALVGESTTDPYAYYDNNVVGTLRLLQAMRRHAVDRIVFSSTCATYGVPQTARLSETHPQSPCNPYGASKLMCERLLADAATAYGLRSVSLRYFNAAGASLDSSLGEAHAPETHLVPNVLLAALGRAPPLRILGSDYPTPDGTCIRDYVHVLDLADAHCRAFDYLDTAPGAHAFNLGSERGLSVLEILRAAEALVRGPIPNEVRARRAGDPPKLVADSSRARQVLGWQPRHSDVQTILETAFAWHRAPKY
jgi:UDP-glucose 4-epimerase